MFVFLLLYFVGFGLDVLVPDHSVLSSFRSELLLCSNASDKRLARKSE